MPGEGSETWIKSVEKEETMANLKVVGSEHMLATGA
jgi:hypothetical protein